MYIVEGAQTFTRTPLPILTPIGGATSLLIVNNMQIFPSISSFSQSCGRKVVVTTASIVLEVVIGQFSQFGWFNAKIFKRFGLAINNLIDRFSLKLISSQDWPPDYLV